MMPYQLLDLASMGARMGKSGKDLRASMLGGMCQYDPECPVHRHRPGTTCPAVYRKRRAAEREAERRQRQRDSALGLVIFVVALVVGALILNQVFPGFLDALLPGFGLGKS